MYRGTIGLVYAPEHGTRFTGINPNLRIFRNEIEEPQYGRQSWLSIHLYIVTQTTKRRGPYVSVKSSTIYQEASRSIVFWDASGFFT